MPCDQIRTMKYDLGKVNVTMFHNALKSAGLNVTTSEGIVRFSGSVAQVGWVSGSLDQGELTLTNGTDAQRDALRRLYSVETVKYASQRMGWALKAAQPNVGVQAFLSTKRGLF